MQIRKFEWNGQELTDPGPEYTAQEVLDMYAGMYPELNNAVISYPEVEGGAYTIEAKGAGSSAAPAAGSSSRVQFKTSVGHKG